MTTPAAATVTQALEQSATFKQMLLKAEQSRICLEWVTPLMNPALRPACLPGPIEGDAWCLLAKNAATASKLKQLLPRFLAQLHVRGLTQIKTIRIKLYLG